MAKHIEQSVTNDILFNVVFGRFRAEDFRIFGQHGGPIGLKFAILELIIREGFWHMPTLKKKLQYSTSSPIREVMTMLNAAEFIRPGAFGIHLSTAKGRLMMDLVRRLLFETRTLKSWAPETLLFLGILNIHPEEIRRYQGIDRLKALTDQLSLLLYSAPFSESAFGVDLQYGKGVSDPKFYVENYGLELEKEITGDFPPVPPLQLSESDILLFIDPVSVQKETSVRRK